MSASANRPSLRAVRRACFAAALLSAAALLAGCGSGGAASSSGKILAVGAENEYANVISQIGGSYVQTTAIESNPNTDPHTFEASPSVAATVAEAHLVVQNGLGYDGYMEKIEAASGGAGSDSTRKVIDVRKLLGLPDSTPNPHLWYKPQTMPAVAAAVARDLSDIDPAHAAYFKANAERFERSLQPWLVALRQFESRHPGVAVATTEPVGDYMLEAAGTRNLTPFSLQADIMNGTDPSPQDVAYQSSLFSAHKVNVFVYNQQVTDSLTETFLKEAAANGIPVVGVYETMPTPGYDYQSWMLAEVKALEAAVAEKVSTRKL
ncbi:MAG: zinc ABC transporter substrate-binding protein [Solirubrobacteraceae bacterium]